MGKVALFHLVCGILIFWSSVSVVKAEDAYKYFTWTVTYGTASPLGVPQQVVILFIYLLIVYVFRTASWYG